LIFDHWVAALAVEGGWRVTVLVGGQFVEQVVQDLHLHLLLGLAAIAVLKWLLDFLSLTVLFLVNVAVARENLLLWIQLIELLDKLLEVR
jgi:hypothetical protein